MKIIKIKNINEIPFPTVTDKTLFEKPLFHGTRLRSIEISNQEREEYYKACDKVIVFANETAKAMSKDDINKYHDNHKGCYFGNVASMSYKTAKNFEYGDLYLTISFGIAAYRYAKNGGGELGEIAYQDALALLDFNIPMNDEIKRNVDVVLEEHQRYLDSECAVLIVIDAKLSDLLDIYGKKPENSKLSFYYTYKESENLAASISFRLLHHEDYQIYVLREKDFTDGIKRFTGVKNINEYLAHLNR